MLLKLVLAFKVSLTSSAPNTDGLSPTFGVLGRLYVLVEQALFVRGRLLTKRELDIGETGEVVPGDVGRMT